MKPAREFPPPLPQAYHGAFTMKVEDELSALLVNGTQYGAERVDIYKLEWDFTPDEPGLDILFSLPSWLLLPIRIWIHIPIRICVHDV